MNWIRRSVWLVALLPAVVALTYVGLASRHPEPIVTHAALHEPPTVWDIEQWLQVDAAPAQPLQRALLLGPLQVPGISLQTAASLAALFAVAIAWFCSRLVRRSAGADGLGTAMAFGGVAALCCSPAFGSLWLYAERAGVFMPPLLLVSALALLQLERGFLWRMLAVLVLVAAAPFCHAQGVLVGLAVLPAVFEAASRAGSNRWLWVAVSAFFGIAASVVSFYPAGGLYGDEAGLLGHLAAAPGERSLDMLAALGSSWLDLWPERRIDELAFGAATVLLLAGAPFLAARLPARASAPWWSCALFGVLLVPWLSARHGFDLQPWLARELRYGSFLLPIGCIGLMAARLGSHTWSLGLGVIATLALQDWPRGIEALRAAHAEIVRVEASLATPPQFVDHRTAALSPYSSLEQQRLFVTRGWAPDPTFDWQAAADDARATPPRDALGTVLSGSPIEMHGMVRSMIVNEHVGAVFVGVLQDQHVELLGMTLPQFAGRGRDAQWRVVWNAPVAEGVQLVAFGYLPRHGKFVRLGTVRTIKDGALVEVSGA